MAEIMSQSPIGSARPSPDVMSFLLMVAALVLLACTLYLIYLGCTAFGAGTFFRAIYSPEQSPDITARLPGCFGG